MISMGLWLANCCKIQQLSHSYSTNYIYVQQDIPVLNLYSTFYIYIQQYTLIFFQLQPKLFSFNKNICSSSTKNNFIQQQYLFNFNPKYFHSTNIIIIQLQPKLISFNNKVPGHSKHRHSTKIPVPPRLNTKQH